VEQGESRQDHEVGLLLPFLAAGIDECHAGCALARAVDVDPDDLGIVAEHEVRFADEIRQDGRLRAGFGIITAAEPLAEAAIGAGTETQAERIGVGLREIARRLREWLVAELARGLAEQRMAERLRLRRRRIGSRSRPFEGIATVMDLAL